MADLLNYRYDRWLTQISVAYTNAAYIADKIAPVIPVGQRQGTYWVFGREAFQTHNTERAPRTRANEVEMDMSPQAFRAAGHALIGSLADEERSEAPDGYNPEPDLISLVTDSLMLGREKRVATMLRNPDNVPNNLLLDEGEKFGQAGSDAMGVFEDMMMQIRRQIGRRPNFAVIPYDVMRVLRHEASLLSQLSNNERGIITTDVLRQLLELEEILVPEVVEDTSNLYQRVVDGQRQGQPEAFPNNLADVWGRDVIFGYRSRNAQRRAPSFAYQFRVRERQQNGSVNRWREQDRHADFYEIAYTETSHLVCPQAGFLLRDAIPEAA